MTRRSYEHWTPKKGNKHREEKTKWAKFTYIGRETRAVTKIFKNTNVKVTFGTDNTIGKLLTTRQSTPEVNMITVEFTS